MSTASEQTIIDMLGSKPDGHAITEAEIELALGANYIETISSLTQQEIIQYVVGMAPIVEEGQPAPTLTKHDHEYVRGANFPPSEATTE